MTTLHFVFTPVQYKLKFCIYTQRKQIQNLQYMYHECSELSERLRVKHV